MEETDNKSRKSKGSFSIGKITKISSDFGKNHDQALLRSDVFESEKLCQRDHFLQWNTIKPFSEHHNCKNVKSPYHTPCKLQKDRPAVACREGI